MALLKFGDALNQLQLGVPSIQMDIPCRSQVTFI